MSTICSDSCYSNLKSLGIGAGLGAGAGAVVGVLTQVSILVGAATGATFMVATVGTAMLLDNYFDKQFTELMKLVITFAAGVLASIVVTPLLTGVSIGLGATLLIDVASTAALLGYRWLRGGQIIVDTGALRPQI